MPQSSMNNNMTIITIVYINIFLFLLFFFVSFLSCFVCIAKVGDGNEKKVIFV